MSQQKLSIFMILAFAFLFGNVYAQEIGEASYYSDALHGNKTASGELYDKNKYTAAHRTLAMGTIVKVTNLANGLSVTLRVNDRGPFKPTRIIDLSRAAAEAVDMVRSGIAQVRIDVVKKPGGQQTSRQPDTQLGLSSPEVVIDIAGQQAQVERVPAPAPEPVVSNISLPNIKSGHTTQQVQARSLPPQTVYRKLPPSTSQGSAARPATTTRNLSSGATMRKAGNATAEDTKGMGLYKFASYEIQQEGYGIQIGAFADYRNVLETTNRLMQNNVQDILIHTKIVDGKDMFRMLIGPFNSRGAAEDFQKTLASLNLKGWILNLREL